MVLFQMYGGQYFLFNGMKFQSTIPATCIPALSIIIVQLHGVRFTGEKNALSLI